MSQIHPTAIVSPKAQLADDVTVGPHTIIEDDVIVGAGCRIASSVLLASGARLGERVKVSHAAVIGTQPQDLKFGGEPTLAKIGDDTMIREYVTVNRGTSAHGESVVGKNCLLMAYSHVAHDCVVGDNVIMANAVNIGGHVEIDEFAIVGGMVPVHQFTKIGAHSMIGGGFRVVQDVVPYALMGGFPLRTIGLNSIGLRRRGFSTEAIRALKQTYKLLFFSELNTTQAVERIRAEVPQVVEVQRVLTFIERSNRGIVKA
jgi:UDP-N-acetylglucosamine acyltransferase